MYIYNTTFLISKELEQKWLSWVKNEYIDFVVNNTRFTLPQVAKIKSIQEISYSVQFHVIDNLSILNWEKASWIQIQKRIKDLFGDEVLSFSTTLEIIDCEDGK